MTVCRRVHCQMTIMMAAYDRVPPCTLPKMAMYMVMVMSVCHNGHGWSCATVYIVKMVVYMGIMTMYIVKWSWGKDLPCPQFRKKKSFTSQILTSHHLQPVHTSFVAPTGDSCLTAAAVQPCTVLSRSLHEGSRWRSSLVLLCKSCAVKRGCFFYLLPCLISYAWTVGKTCLNGNVLA